MESQPPEITHLFFGQALSGLRKMTIFLAASFALIFACLILGVVLGYFEDKHRDRERNSN
jgi:hypothetical protein